MSRAAWLTFAVLFLMSRNSEAQTAPRRVILSQLTAERTDGLVPYDDHVDPDFPADAPMARALYNKPENWNLDRDIDVDFQRGYRFAGDLPATAAVAAVPRPRPATVFNGPRSQLYRFAALPSDTQVVPTHIEGPYFASVGSPNGLLSAFPGL